MTQLELFRATVEHRPRDRFLYYCSFTQPLAETLIDYFNVETTDQIFERFDVPLGVGFGPNTVNEPEPREFLRYYEDVTLPAGMDLLSHIDGKGVLQVPGSMYHFTHRVSPLRNATSFSDIEQFTYQKVEDLRTDHFAQTVRDAHAAEKHTVCWIGHMYEDAWQVRGYEEFLMDMITAPENCEYILDRYCERNIAVARAAAAAGADMIRTGDDVANQNTLMFSIDDWRRFMKSRWAKVYAAAREIKPDIQIWYHSDGNVTDIVPELIDIGVTVLNPVQPECLDIHHLKKQYGGSLVFDGTIGTQSTMPFGTPEEVRSVIRSRKRELGADGALVISPTHVLEPEVTPQNVEAFLDEAGRPLE